MLLGYFHIWIKYYIGQSQICTICCNFMIQVNEQQGKVWKGKEMEKFIYYLKKIKLRDQQKKIIRNCKIYNRQISIESWK
ncbi:unnamed protein product [Paramecium sonneborni]|uniref:Uncharacterized protein n=1 Tax=Paramecium sonneborni TaxID=65129 RepID=A0A8S1RM69_9CILI|nr:unnamed protein product [Paramecium sonneborni]